MQELLLLVVPSVQWYHGLEKHVVSPDNLYLDPLLCFTCHSRSSLLVKSGSSPGQSSDEFQIKGTRMGEQRLA